MFLVPAASSKLTAVDSCGIENVYYPSIKHVSINRFMRVTINRKPSY